MLKMIRKNVLVDLGPPCNVLGANLIEVPDKYKRISSRGKIVSVGHHCQSIEQDAVGKECIIGINHNPESKFNPKTSEKLGLKPHWHFIIHEKLIHTILDK